MHKSNAKKLLFLSYYFPPLGMGGVQRATKFVHYIADFGWDPTVITVKDIHYYAKDSSLLNEVNRSAIIRTGSFDPARLIYLFMKLYQKKKRNQHNSVQTSQSTFMNRVPYLTKYLFYPDSKKLWLPFAKHKIEQLIRIKKFRAVISTSPPISSHLLAAQINLPWIADFRDYWTIGDGIYAPTKWHRLKYHKIMTLITQKASKIIAISEPIADSIRQIAEEKNRNKISVILNGFDPNDFMGIKPKKFDRFTFVYTGNLNQQRSPDNFFTALELVLGKKPKLRDCINCYFVGRHFDLKLSPIPAILKDRVFFVDYLPHKQSLSYTLAADVLLLLLSSDSAEGVVTGKVFEYLGTQKPILAIIPKTVAAYQLLQNMPNCYFGAPDDVRSIKAAIAKLLENHFGREIKTRNYDKLPPYLKEFTRREQTRRLAILLDQIIETH